MPPVKKKSRSKSVTSVKMEYVSFFRRLLSYLVDGAITFLITSTLAFFYTGSNPFAALTADSMTQLGQFNQAQRSLNLLSILFSACFYIVMWVNFNGQTPGKKMMGIRIVKSNGSGLSYSDAIVRYIGYYISAIFLGIGFIWAAFDKKHQTWHDKISDTVVVKTNQKPVTVLALIIALIFIMFYGSLMGLSVKKGWDLGVQQYKSENKEKIENKNTSDSMKRYLSEMNPQAKVHYDKTQELFLAIRTGTKSRAELEKEANVIIAEAKLALAAEETNPLLWTNLANAYSWPNTIADVEDGLNAFKKAEELDPDNVIFINFVGDQLVLMKRYDEAVLQFQKSLRLTDRSGYAYYGIGRAYHGLGLKEEARSNFEKAIEVFKSINDAGAYDAQILNAQKLIQSLEE